MESPMSDKKIIREINPYPIKNLPKSWQEAVRFHGCDEAEDARVAYFYGHSGKGWYVWCNEYPEEGCQFLGKRKPR